jgi:SAM-dependent methyltransferase
MISSRLLAVVQCPECAGQLAVDGSGVRCAGCRRTFEANGTALDLRPRQAFSEQTKYLDETLHADARHESIAPPLLGSGVRFRMLRRFLQPAAGDRIVDLGCGSGRVLAWAEASGADLLGVDVSPYFAPEAARRFDLVLGDLRRLPLRSGAFTKAWSLDVLEHLSPDALADMLAEANRVLADDGALFVYTHVRKNGPLASGVRAVNALGHLLERLGLMDLKQERLRKSDHLNPMATHDELRAVAERAGFRIERITYYTPIVGAFVENVVVRLGERVLVRRRRRRLAGGAAEQDAVRDVRRAAQARMAARGPSYRLLAGATRIMQLDVRLFGRIPSGPFFALLRKTHPATRTGWS